MALIDSPLSNVGVRPFHVSISTAGNVHSHHEVLPSTVALTGGNHITTYTGSDPNADVFAEVAGAGPTLIYEAAQQVFGAQYNGAQYLLNTGTWPNRVAGGSPKAYTYHCLVRVDQLPNALGSAIMGVCSTLAANRYIQHVITQPASGFTRFSASKRGDSDTPHSAVFTSLCIGQYLDMWVVHDGTNVSVYVEGVRLATLPCTATAMTPNRGIMGALALAGVLSTFAYTTELFHTWYNVAFTTDQMREVNDAFTNPRFRTRGNLTNGKLTIVNAGSYQRSSANCSPWRTNVITIAGTTYVIDYAQGDTRVEIRSKPVASETWDGAGGDNNPAEGNDSAADGHNTPCIGYSADGRIHYAFDMHGVQMKYGSSLAIAATGVTAAGFGNFLPYTKNYTDATARTTDNTLTSLDVGIMARQLSDDSSWILVAVNLGVPVWGSTWGELAFTYPNFVTLANGDLLLVGRDGRSGQGFQPVIAKFDHITGARSHINILFDNGTGPDPYNFYTQLYYDPVRNRLWFSGVCRHGASAGVQSNEGIYVFYVDCATFQARDVTGALLSLPLSNATAPKCATVGFNREIINQQTMCVDETTGFPIILMHYAPAVGGVIDLHMHWWDGSAWQQRALGILTANHSYGEPAGTISNPGAALPATTGAALGRPGSLVNGGKLYFWMAATQWGQGLYEFTLPIVSLAAATPTKILVIADQSYKVQAPNVLWAVCDSATPDLGRLRTTGVVSFTHQRTSFDPNAFPALTYPGEPLFLYERTLPGNPIAPPLAPPPDTSNMGTLSTYLVNKLLDHTLGSPDFAPPANIFLAAFVAGVESAQIARKSVAVNSTNFPAASARTITLNVAQSFAAASADAGAVDEIRIFDASSGGNELARDALTAAVTVNNGGILTVGVGQLSVVCATGVFSDYLAHKLLNLAFAGTAFTRPATVFMSGWVGNPQGAGTQGTNARASVTNNSTNWPAASARAKSLAVLQDAGAEVGGSTCDYVAIHDASSAGNLLFSGLAVAPIVLSSGNHLEFRPSETTITVV